jgi:hypothetical protein
MKCFDIVHHSSASDSWKSNPNFKYKHHGVKDKRKPNKRSAYSVMTSHPFYQKLRYQYGPEGKARRNIVVGCNEVCIKEENNA